MNPSENRRGFLVQGAAATAGMMVTGSALSQNLGEEENRPKVSPLLADESHGYPRTHAGLGGPVGTATDRGKLVAGFRGPKLPPVPLTTPDLEKLPFEMVKGAKEFHLHPMPVRRELLPGMDFHVYGYNRSYSREVPNWWPPDNMCVTIKFP